MLNTRQMFAERLSAHSKELSRYLRYIVTGHIVIAMVFIVGAMSVYYQQFLEDIPDYFPSGWVIAVVLGLSVMYSPIQLLLKRADIVFLIPAEHRLHGYFRRALVYSFFSQLYWFVAAIIAVAPLYIEVFPDSSFLWLFIVLLIVKAWSLMANWWMLRVRDRQLRRIDKLVRAALIITLVYFYVVQEPLFLCIVTALLALLYGANFMVGRRNPGLNWDLLIENDYRRMRRFYRLANMFTDVPHMETEIKKRHWLVRLLTSRFPFKQSAAYPYLYRITTVRSGEYLGIYLRLLVIGGLLIYFVPNQWLKLIFALLFVYMIFLQIVPLWKHHVTIVWLDLYPIPFQERRQAFLSWMQQMTASAAVVFILLLLVMGQWLAALLMLVLSLLFVWQLVPVYLQKKIET
ncbi:MULTISPECIES: ABC transporter permease [Gracilibacillus]|uniref:ABC transporter permease n=1 Tax=Gracilibacillus TaxID=74385 RepID=UPI000824EE03|nr:MULTISPECIES: ABC transporter permease [Gracilibacillus]